MTMTDTARRDEMSAEEYNAMQVEAKPRKYRNKPVVIDNIQFDSTAEGNRYEELKHQLKACMIDQLELQPRFDLLVNGVKVGSYVADFRYLDPTTMTYVVEDVKGVKTPVYRLKRKLMKAIHGIEIVEVR